MAAAIGVAVMVAALAASCSGAWPLTGRWPLPPLVRLALLARRHSARPGRSGRPGTLGDLTVGEPVVMLPVAVRGSTR